MIHVEQGGPPETARADLGRRASVSRKAHFRRAGDKNPSGAEMKAEEDRGGSSTWDSFAGGPDAATARVREPYPAGLRPRAALVHGVGAPIRRRVVPADSGTPGRVMLAQRHECRSNRRGTGAARAARRGDSGAADHLHDLTRPAKVHQGRVARPGCRRPSASRPSASSCTPMSSRRPHHLALLASRVAGGTVPTPSIRDRRDRYGGGEDHHVDSRETRRTSHRSPRRRDMRRPQRPTWLSQ